MNAYDLHLLSLAGALAAGAIGWQIVFGLAGSLNLAAATAMGLGAYAAILLPLEFGLPYGLAIPAAALIAATALGLVGLVTARLETHYFALATLAIAEAAVLLATNWESVTGGANGALGPQPPAWLATGEGRALLAWAMALTAALLFFGFRRAFGDARLALLRAQPLAARSFGVDARRVRVWAMAAGGACGGLGGAAHAMAVGVVSPDALAFKTMAAILAVVLIGGRRSPLAAAILAVAVTFAPEYLRFLEDIYLVAYGAILLLAILFLPEGLAAWFPRVAWAAVKPLTPPPPSTLAGPPLAATGLTRRFGGLTAVDGVSLTLRPGEVAGLIGPNGAGKSTLLNMLSGLERPDAGAVTLAAGARIGRTFQTPALIEDATAGENLAVAGAGDPAADPRPARSLGQGERRFLELARAQAYAHGVLLLDEPAAGLSPAERARLAGEIAEAARSGLAVLVVEHDVPFLAGVASRMICLAEGRVIADGPTADVVRDPAVAEAYLGAPLTMEPAP